VARVILCLFPSQHAERALVGDLEPLHIIMRCPCHRLTHLFCFPRYLQRVEVTDAASLNAAKYKWFRKVVDPSFNAPSPSYTPQHPASFSAQPPPQQRPLPSTPWIEAAKGNVWLYANVASMVAALLTALGVVLSDVLYHVMYRVAFAAQLVVWTINFSASAPRFQASKEYLLAVFANDSAHYMFYSLLFLFSAPTIICLAPLMIYSFFNSIPMIEQRFAVQSAQLARFKPWQFQVSTCSSSRSP
jgi:hypothetical protein